MDKLSRFDQARAIVFGSLLGDGCLEINKGYQNARFSFRHSAKQKDYFFWKARKTSIFSSNKSIWIQDETNKDNSFGKIKLRFQSKALPELTKIWNVTHINNQKTINNKWLDMITPLSLATWWLDDGSLVGNSRKGVFCTDSFSQKEIKLLKDFLDNKLGINAKTCIVNKSAIRLNIYSTNDLKKFFKIIAPYVEVESMLYKILLLYQDDKYQESWISEIFSKTSYSKKVISKITNERKKKWKMFRK